ncbi:MAG: hypothetical protein ACREQ5_18695 [Candidatus Dormibacteria bacterium]
MADVLPWDLDGLDADQLADAYRDLAHLVEWLRSLDVPVPSCWWWHGWSAHRLLLLRHWYPMAVNPASTHPKAAAEWWAALRSLQLEWSAAGLFDHRGAHLPGGDPAGEKVAMPPFDDHLGEVVARRRREPSLAPAVAGSAR